MSTRDRTMIERSRRVPVLVILFLNLWAVQTNCSAATPPKNHVSVLLTLNTFSGSKRLASGIEVYSGKAIIQVVALRDDVVRVRIARDGVLPEDASWAVLSSARQDRANVSTESGDGVVGFRTKRLRVQIERTSLRLIVTDLDGIILQEDAL